MGPAGRTGHLCSVRHRLSDNERVLLSREHGRRTCPVDVPGRRCQLVCGAGPCRSHSAPGDHLPDGVGLLRRWFVVRAGSGGLDHERWLDVDVSNASCPGGRPGRHRMQLRTILHGSREPRQRRWAGGRDVGRRRTLGASRAPSDAQALEGEFRVRRRASVTQSEPTTRRRRPSCSTRRMVGSPGPTGSCRVAYQNLSGVACAFPSTCNAVGNGSGTVGGLIVTGPSPAPPAPTLPAVGLPVGTVGATTAHPSRRTAARPPISGQCRSARSLRVSVWTRVRER